MGNLFSKTQNKPTIYQSNNIYKSWYHDYDYDYDYDDYLESQSQFGLFMFSN